MPIEIRELLIKTAIRDGTPEQSSSQNQTTTDSDAIIAACVEQVLAILQEKTER